MGTIFEQINALPILDVLDSLSIWYRKKWANTYLLRDDWSMDESFAVSHSKNIAKDFWKSWIEWWPLDFVWQYCLWIAWVDMKTNVWRATTVKFFIDKGLVQAQNTQTEFKPSIKEKDLLTSFNDHKLNGYKEDISAFLLTRGVPYELIQKDTLLIGEIFKDIGYYDNFYCTELESFKDEEGKWQNQHWDTPKTVSVFMFPCYDQDKNVIGIKLRRRDWKTIRGKKSLAVWKTWLLYNEIDKELMYLVEWEMDYIILSLLWYKNIIANEGWVQSLRAMIKSKLSETKKIICLYDNDVAWAKWKQTLEDTLKRPIYDIVYPVRENQDGKKLADVNDLYEVGYDTKAKWDKIFSEAKKVGKDEKIEHKTDFIYLRATMEYYDIAYRTVQRESSVATFMWSTVKELSGMVKNSKIKEYKDLCYHYGWKEGYYNTMNEKGIMNNPWDAEAIIHPDIEYLISNICHKNQKNIDWLHKAILFKLTHINDVSLPALILYWPQWSWKWSLLNLLAVLFWEDNLQKWLGMQDLKWTHDSYQGEKLIVEYKEVSSWNTKEDKWIADKIKWIVTEQHISIRALYKNARTIENRAWFHFSSNHAIPLQMDSKESGNRRYTVIKTWPRLDRQKGYDINKVTLKNKLVIRQYVAWLYETYPDIPKSTHLRELDNEEKRVLVENCESAANRFFEWFERKYPTVWKLTNKEKNTCLNMYCHEVWEDLKDLKFKQKNFDIGLSHRYEKKYLSIRWKTIYWYLIHKTDFDREHIPSESHGMFNEWEINNSLTNNYGAWIF